ncbi:hypothetical protein GLOTRDRAFT_94009 [Gloeophyllum trabeum ATCC 11539]|uniref:C3H1-type domain-containing protein n=1 Tax=Gloeophyllum trabeum (strain ATCC 11539 / FP-39264 / Madison 617) TaxID=670483 RepID=S7Q3G5_GLOTA|nr:uncharacterized protein GLOTRDRAFT_94009 [Gloeophyllum trabeum ATCC 11539]EPQ54521.1 hypothetical protein GLOTRDRAFT_94009 [Gloeophyllum trabeum ATCC 11539]
MAGFCAHGNTCRFAHPSTSSALSAGPSRPPARATLSSLSNSRPSIPPRTGSSASATTAEGAHLDSAGYNKEGGYCPYGLSCKYYHPPPPPPTSTPKTPLKDVPSTPIHSISSTHSSPLVWPPPTYKLLGQPRPAVRPSPHTPESPSTRRKNARAYLREFPARRLTFDSPSLDASVTNIMTSSSVSLDHSRNSSLEVNVSSEAVTSPPRDIRRVVGSGRPIFADFAPQDTSSPPPRNVAALRILPSRPGSPHDTPERDSFSLSDLSIAVEGLPTSVEALGDPICESIGDPSFEEDDIFVVSPSRGPSLRPIRSTTPQPSSPDSKSDDLPPFVGATLPDFQRAVSPNPCDRDPSPVVRGSLLPSFPITSPGRPPFPDPVYHLDPAPSLASRRGSTGTAPQAAEHRPTLLIRAPLTHGDPNPPCSINQVNSEAYDVSEPGEPKRVLALPERPQYVHASGYVPRTSVQIHAEPMRRGNNAAPTNKRENPPLFLGQGSVPPVFSSQPVCGGPQTVRSNVKVKSGRPKRDSAVPPGGLGPGGISSTRAYEKPLALPPYTQGVVQRAEVSRRLSSLGARGLIEGSAPEVPSNATSGLRPNWAVQGLGDTRGDVFSSLENGSVQGPRGVPPTVVQSVPPTHGTRESDRPSTVPVDLDAEITRKIRSIERLGSSIDPPPPQRCSSHPAQRNALNVHIAQARESRKVPALPVQVANPVPSQPLSPVPLRWYQRSTTHFRSATVPNNALGPIPESRPVTPEWSYARLPRDQYGTRQRHGSSEDGRGHRQPMSHENPRIGYGHKKRKKNRKRRPAGVRPQTPPPPRIGPKPGRRERAQRQRFQHEMEELDLIMRPHSRTPPPTQPRAQTSPPKPRHVAAVEEEEEEEELLSLVAESP